MDDSAKQRLFGARYAFEHPVTLWVTVVVVGILVIAALVVAILGRTGRLTDETRLELQQRIRSWCLLAPLMIGPILLGGAWVMLAVLILSICCYREFARATGLFRSPLVSLSVVVGILAIAFAVADHWYGFFSALPALGVIVIAAVAVLSDRPEGYIQRVALGVLAFLLFGVCLGHLGYLANDLNFRAMILLLLLSVELNDVFAYLTGKGFGRRKLAPNTSPNKTVGGALGAVLLTTTLVTLIGRMVFSGTAMESWGALVGLGVIVSVAGQLGDLMLSSIKRDVGIKDMGVTLPGHGGLLDRFDSLLLAAPAFFHYVGYVNVNGIGLEQAKRIISLGVAG
jgi:phosphatidate cytidylyltransferase